MNSENELEVEPQLSEKENDLNTPNVQINKINSIIEPEVAELKSAINETSNDGSEATEQIAKPKKRRQIVDSDSEIDEVEAEVKHKKHLAIVSDSDEEELCITPHNKSFNEDLELPLSPHIIDNVDTSIFVVNTKGRLVTENNSEDVTNKSRIAALCDSESSEEETFNKSMCASPPTVKKHARPTNEPKKMTAKVAQQQRQEIRSESQRMLRESRVSLPYHKPKARSIKEFLQQRPRLSLSLIGNVPPSIAMKMSVQQLEIVTKQLEERKKEVREFYKSESESEEENLVEDKTEEHLQVETNECLLPETSEVETIDCPELPEETSEHPLPEIETNEDSQLLVTRTEAENTTDLVLSCENNEQETIVERSVDTNTVKVAENLVEATSNELDPNNSNIQNGGDSFEFDFNLDEPEDDVPVEPTENNAATEDEHLQRLLKKYEADDCVATEQKQTKFDLLKQLGTVQPRLSGGPDQEIDLDAGVTKPSAVVQLMERFMQHAVPKSQHKDKVELDVINLSQGELRRETVAMVVDQDDEPVCIMEKPGIKLRKLKNELESQMAQRRSELWQQKHQPMIETDDADDEKSECGADDDDDILDDDEEAELTDDESTEEEDNCEIADKPRVKSAFVDEEAEESDGDDNDEVDNISQADGNEPTEDVEESEEELMGVKKTLRRIIKGFTEDSDDDDDAGLDTAQKNEEKCLDTTDTWDDEDILPPNRLRVDKTPHKDMTQSRSELGFLTPVQYLTGVQGSASKFLRDDSPASLFSLPADPSPFRDFPKKLFSDSCDTLDSETNMDDIAQLCSGKFASQIVPEKVDSTSDVLTTTTQDLLNICSGSFPDIIVPATTAKSIEAVRMKPTMQLNLITNNEVKHLDDDDGIISQLLNEEEMEVFKKKFESPVADLLSNNRGNESEGEVQGGGRFVSDSSDDEDEIKNTTKTTKRLQKKLAFSDDESESESEIEDERIDLHDDQLSDDTNLDKVDYDSEENEIEYEQKSEANILYVPQQKMKISDFLENEAELSESDWDSADEDEKGLDELEVEQGDAEVFDENKMRSDLEKIHMRRVLDQDTKEIKILQELLLEDGELHGTGRQRQFRWRNINDATNENEAGSGGEIETYLDEEESEEQWRRARHQREMFLKTKQEKLVVRENDEFISVESESQVLKMGHEVVRKSLSTVLEKSVVTPSVSEVKKPLMLLNTRGSFLARNDKFLNRLAEFTKVTTTSVVGQPKNGKKIVFQTLDNSTNEGSGTVTVISKIKRKAESGSGTPSMIKKLRLSSTMSPVVANVNRKKQLFKSN